MKHVPVLAGAVIRAFETTNVRGGTYADLTLGLAGHASLIAKTCLPKRIIGLDRDQEMLERAEAVLRNEVQGLEPHPALEFYHSNYSDIDKVCGVSPMVDAILLDLGVASPHFDSPERGLSFRFEGPLDMRLDRKQQLTAAKIVNTFSEHELGRILREYGEERHWRAVARRLAAIRHEPMYKPLCTTTELTKLIEPILGPRQGRIHPATKTFQALRMAVNDELGHLELVLPKAVKLLKPDGKLAVITFHSLEDRIVKQFFTKAMENGHCSAITKNPIEANKNEISLNPRSRSAKLRVLTR